MPTTCPCPEPKYQSRSEAYSLTLSQHTFLRWGVVSTFPNPQAGGSPLVGCPRLLIQYIHSYPSPNPQAGGPPLVGCPRLLTQYICSHPPYWTPFLHPQPVDALCRGDKDPLVNILLKIWIAQKAENFLSGWVELGIGFSTGFLLHRITKPTEPRREGDISILDRPVGYNFPSVWQER